MAIAFILRLPARDGWSGGRRCDEMTTNLDVVPTLLDLLDIETPGNVQGKSFAALLDGGAYEPHEAVFGELTYHDYYDPRRSIRTDTHKLIANFAAAPSFMDSSQSWRPRSDTVVPFSNAQAYHRPFELYDLKADPWEQNNLAQDREHIELAKGLMARLYQHMVETEDPLLDGAVTSPLHEKTIGYLRGVD
jgi:arylsulfatase A-like enzyme